MLKVFEANSRDNLEKLLFNQIEKDLKSGEKVILVVPAQASLSVEKKAFDILGSSGFFDLRIVRGQKLHDEIMHECGYPGLTSVNTIGRSMLLRRIASQNKEALGTFSSVSLEDGFIDMSGDFIVQLKQNDLDEKKLDKLVELSKGLLKGKLSDMKLMYLEYEKALAGRFTDSEDLLAFVTNKIKDCSFIKEYKIYYYGFYSFTQRELKYLAELEKYSKGLCVALECGKGSNFEVTRKTSAKLLNLVPGAECIKDDAKASILGNLSSDKMCIVNCANPFSMAESIAADIRRLVRERSYNYSDFAVYCGNSPQIVSAIKKVFSSYNIPLFADEKRSILHNNAVDAVISLLDIINDDFTARDVIRFCKSGIMNFEYDDIENLDHYVKRYHIKSDKFHAPFKYGKEEFEECFDRLEEMRKVLSDVLPPFKLQMQSSKSVLDKLKTLYAFIEDEQKLSARLDALALAQAEEGFVDAAEESAQVFDALVGIMNQMAELIGTEEISIKDFSDIFINACRDVKVGVLPQAQGRVSLGQMGRSFADDVKAMYIAGFNDGLIPEEGGADGILTENELNLISAQGINLSKSSDALYEESLFSVCRTLSCCKEYLWMGCLMADQNGDSIKASNLLSDISKAYPDIPVRTDISAPDDDTVFLEGKDLAKSQLVKELRNSIEGKEMSPLWKEVYNEVKADSAELIYGLKYKNIQKPLGKELAKTLFSKDRPYSFSPSRMDGFASCPFKHFVHYGLRPEEPKEFGIGGSEAGIVYHEVLMRLCKDIDDWNLVSDSDLENRIDIILKDISENKLDGVLLSGKAEIYTSKRIRNVCIRFAKHMAEEIRKSGIEKMYLESRFSGGGVFPPIVLNTSAGTVYIEGQIDRVDVCRRDDGQYVRVIDYKSGSTKFSKKLVEAGLQLQLMVYLKAATGDFSDDTPAGVFYFSIKDPQVSANLEDLPAEEISDEVLAKIKKTYRLDGMDVDSEFKSQFMAILTNLCEKLVSGNIDISPKQMGSLYDSCAYCAYASICCKDIIF